MSTAVRVLVSFGVIVIAYGLVLGVPLARVRAAHPVAPRHLVTTHLSALMQGPVALGSAYALSVSGFDSDVATVAAWVFVTGLALEVIGGTTNWLTNTGDQFAERSAGLKVNTVSGPLSLAGGLAIAVGVLTSM
jgi:hypothetical protein